MEITSVNNPKIKELAKLLNKKNRFMSDFFLVEGKHLVEEAASAGLLKEVYSTTGQGIKVTKDIIKKLSTTETPQELIGVVIKPKQKAMDDKVLVLNKIQDPGNIGTLIRTAKAFGYNTVITNIKDIYNSKIVRSSQGAIFTMNVIPQKTYKDLDGYQLVGTVVRDAQDIKNFTPNNKHAIVLGNEASGLVKEEIADMNELVTIKSNFESLNVAVAGSIVMNEYK